MPFVFHFSWFLRIKRSGIIEYNIEIKEAQQVIYCYNQQSIIKL